MALTLILGNPNYSSWSMRAWLLLQLGDIPFEEVLIDLYKPGSRDRARALGSDNGMVPALDTGDFVVWDSLAIAEYLDENRFPVWPKAQPARSLARSYCCEIHAGLNALRSAMPVNIRARGQLPVTPAVQADIDRVLAIWAHCLARFPGPWLLGEFGVLDIYFAPVATRFQTYGVTLPATGADYQARLLAHPLVQAWCERALADTTAIEATDRILAGQSVSPHTP